MGFPLAEIIRIAAAPVGVAVPGGALIAPGMIALANELDKEDDPGTPAAVRKMKKKRREDWIKYRVDVEKDNLKKLKKYPEAARSSIKRTLDEAAGRDLEAVIKGDIHETEGRFADDDEVRLYANAVSARVREELA